MLTTMEEDNGGAVNDRWPRRWDHDNSHAQHLHSSGSARQQTQARLEPSEGWVPSRSGWRAWLGPLPPLIFSLGLSSFEPWQAQ